MTEQLPIPTRLPQLDILNIEQIRELHAATLEILRQTGVKMESPQGRELLLEAGAWESNGRIKIPEVLVDDALASAPSRIPMHDRLGNLTMPLELGKVFFGSGSDTIYTLDLETGKRRRATAADVLTFAQLCDSLENIDFVMSMSNPSDVDSDDQYIHSFANMLRGTVKPNVYTAKDLQDMKDIYRIAAAVAGDEITLREKPFFLQYSEPISPLFIIEESLQKVIFCAEKGIPVGYIPSPNPGGGGPITVAGSVVLGNAECLLGMIIAQLINPGTPYIYGMNTAALDMKTTIVSYGSPEWSLGMAAWTSLAHYYGLPVWGYGGATDSKTIDAQAGIEATFSIMTAFLSRNTLVHDVGYIEFGTTSSLEMLVIADEIISMTRSLCGGMPVNANTLALDATHRVRPGGGYIADKHTLENFRSAQWTPRIIDRRYFDDWQEAGSPDMFTRANERAREILAASEVPPLPAQAEDVIEDILAERKARRGD
ncbi:MAG: trimethylamine methyltransferase family protein [Anaerolineales bacterium]|nr:trimethylamine methyltransferase family protein [Anaerolineales bacterium]